MPDLRQIYDQLAGEQDVTANKASAGGVGEGRQHFVDAAQEVADISLPALRPDGTQIEVQPYSSLPGKAIRGLASRLAKTLFPASTPWYDYILTAGVDARINLLDDKAQADVRAELKDLFAERRDLVFKFMAHRQVKAKITSLIRRLLVEGQVGMQVLKNKVRTFPLRQIAVKRHSGDLTFWIIKELRMATAKDFDRHGASPESFIYTLVDVHNKEVSQQIDNEAPESMGGKDGGDVRQYLLPVGEFPEHEDYVHGFAWHFKGLLNEVDNLAASLGEATANAAWAVLLINQVAGVTAEEVQRQWRTGHAAIANAEHFQWLTSGVKLSDWQFVGAVLNDLRGDLREIFLDEEPSLQPDVTATAILRRIERIDAQTADLSTALETTLQVPLVTAIEVAQGLGAIEVEAVEEPIQIAITTGSSALQQDMRSMRALQKIDLVKKIDPSVAVDGLALLNEISRGDGFNYDKVAFRLDPAAQGQQNGQAAPIPAGGRSDAGGPQPELEQGAQDAREIQRPPPAAA